MPAELQIHRTRKTFADDLKVGDVFAAGQEDPEDRYKTVLYTVVQTYPVQAEDKTVTIQVAYQFGEHPSGTRVLGLGRNQLVCCI